MKKPIVVALSTILILCIQTGSFACSEGILRSLKEEGLSPKQIQLICEKAKLYDAATGTQTSTSQGTISEDQLKKDLEAMAKVAKVSFFDGPRVVSIPISEFCAFGDIKKTNGIPKGSNNYTVEFTGTITLKQPARGADNLSSRLVPSKAGPLPAGYTESLKGSVLYEQTEKGWRISKYDLKAKSGRLGDDGN